MKTIAQLSLFICLNILIGQEPIDYQTEIQTIFNSKCGNCHLGNSSGGLNLSTYQNLMAGGNSGAVIVPGDHANSYLWQRVNNGEMPPGDNPDLTASQVSLVALWIDEGALENPVYTGPVWHVATTGSDSTGDGSSDNPFATIQTAIDSSSDGDTVLVAAGTYNRFIVGGNHRYIMSTHGRDSTIIYNEDGVQGTGVQDADSIFIDGFTFDGGPMGLGIWDATNVNVSNIRITNIVAPDWSDGSAIFGNPASYLIIDNLIIEN